MPYCIQTDILEQITEDELIQLTDDAGAGTIDATVVTRAIDDADAEADTYYATRYDVPLSPVPAMARKLSVDLALYNLYSRRLSIVPEERQRRYDAGVRYLRDVSKGIVSLGAESPAPDSDGGPVATTTKSDRIYSLGHASDLSSGSLDNY